MLADVEQTISKCKYLTKETKILVGVSGGADSIVLATILHHQGFNIGIAHCHFNLRGEDADEDQRFVEQFAAQLKVPFYTIKFETQTYADTRKVSIQMAARDLRYFWFEKLCKEEQFDQIAVGTHLTDNIETFLFNATKGTGLSGLRGIKPVNKKVIRPLLNLTKEDIYQYATAQQLKWREDVSNQSVKYHRNKIRHKIIPVLKEINPNLEGTFQRNFNTLSRVDAFVLSEVEKLWNAWVLPDGKGWKLSKNALVDHPFSDVVLQYKLKPFGFNLAQVADLLEAVKGQPGAMISSIDYHLYIDREFVFIQQKRFFSAPQEYKITEFLGEIKEPVSLVFTDHHADEVDIVPNKNTAYFDFDTLSFPLTLRKWKDGDNMIPFGMKGKKKVSDLLIDNKIPNHQKEDVWVIESGADVCWVIGIRSSNRFRVSATTKRVYRVEVN